MIFTFYEVGGKIRDEILGLDSKDVDYVAVPHETLLEQHTEAEDMFNVLVDYLTKEGFTIFLITANCFTVRAMFPKGHKYTGVADFVMARKEIGYVEGTRTPIVKPGSLYDDLERRDFTLNALARGEDGVIIDYFDGQLDLERGILRTPLDANVTMMDDPLRILRALRFSITKGFDIHPNIYRAMEQPDILEKLELTVSGERIREELIKMFKHDTIKTLRRLDDIDQNVVNGFYKIIFNNGLWLKPTFEQ